MIYTTEVGSLGPFEVAGCCWKAWHLLQTTLHDKLEQGEYLLPVIVLSCIYPYLPQSVHYSCLLPLKARKSSKAA